MPNNKRNGSKWEVKVVNELLETSHPSLYPERHIEIGTSRNISAVTDNHQIDVSITGEGLYNLDLPAIQCHETTDSTAKDTTTVKVPLQKFFSISKYRNYVHPVLAVRVMHKKSKTSRRKNVVNGVFMKLDFFSKLFKLWILSPLIINQLPDGKLKEELQDITRKL